MAIRHFLSLRDLSPAELEQVINLAIEMKAAKLEDRQEPVFAGKVLGMIFEKSSTRTRVSFEAGMAQLGGDALFLSPNDTQLGRGEPIEDSARVISRMVDMVMIRTHGQEIAERFAAYSRVPVINALTDKYHPCQLLADIQTFTEHRGSIKGKTVAWIGDGNNMCNSWINAAIQFNFNLQIACPAGYEPCADLLAEASNLVSLSHNPVEAATGAHLVTTDVFASMGQEQEQQERLQKFAGFQVNHELMSHAADRALFMHCLPAHREEEVSTALLEDTEISVVWDEAENRLHAQKALMLFLMQASS
ncbi:MAG: ornithine carbamoyltransferase [Porticoccaceae bacterium]|jgi:ornithine carbamoyltransferase|nr:ornithine carbamoyltransferase [Porticoccaceae bacterium]MBT6318645.1 ornithine carbamoyltransferase [Porticoccaceae bacterium]MBT7258290.1 ornithine carbamoyltransferase [Porticoccaceae bacterium]MBT7904998.1 ornithine carbamoyltransferase [Porticoccaceae bacterium]MDA9839675.1 ornithine carbamoyltransferase [Porticoccaceae bacterium]